VLRQTRPHHVTNVAYISVLLSCLSHIALGITAYNSLLGLRCCRLSYVRRGIQMEHYKRIGILVRKSISLINKLLVGICK